MAQIKNQFDLGIRWLTCGWRLFRRNPWMLGGMGFSGAFLFTLLALIPFLGNIIIGFVAPIMLASAYVAVDMVSQLKRPLPAALRMAAIKKSPIELVSIFRDESRVLPAAVVSIIGVLTTVLANILMQLVAGNVWTRSWTGLDLMSTLIVLAATAVGLLVFILLALAMVYAMPLAFLQHEPLFPSIGRSFKVGARHLFALMVLFAALLMPIILGGVVSYLSLWIAYLLAFTVSAIVLPIVVSGLYCSYRTLFPAPRATA